MAIKNTVSVNDIVSYFWIHPLKNSSHRIFFKCLEKVDATIDTSCVHEFITELEFYSLAQRVSWDPLAFLQSEVYNLRNTKKNGILNTNELDGNLSLFEWMLWVNANDDFYIINCPFESQPFVTFYLKIDFVCGIIFNYPCT